MSAQDDKSKALEELRRRAKITIHLQAGDIPEMSADEIRTLIHDLRTHQIELEMQNEELQRSQLELTISRDRYSVLYNNSPVGYATIDPEGLMTEVNFTLVDMLGVARSALTNHLFSDFVLAEDQDIFFLHRRAMSQQDHQHGCRLRMKGRDSETLWIELNSVLIAAENGNERLFQTVISDITARKEAQAERDGLERQVMHAQKLESLGVLAGGIAHDFNNILVSILGNANLAISSLNDNAPEIDYIKQIEEATHRGAELTSQMLAYSGKGTFVVEQVNLQDLIQEMTSLLNVSISKKAKVRHEFSAGAKPIEGDATQLRQVIMNLIINGSEALGDSNGTITVVVDTAHCDQAYLDTTTGRAELEPGAYTYLRVTDTGCGMNADTLHRIFEPFFTTKFTGRGLGLAAVVGIVQAHKGALDIISELGRGTTIKVLFPASLDPAPQEPVARLATDCSTLVGRTIMVVDDEAPVRNVTATILRRREAQVVTAESGLVALEILKDRPGNFDCIVLDLTMPGLDGVETLKEMRLVSPEIRIVLVSGYNPEMLADRLAPGEFDGFLQKPFSADDLCQHLLAMLSR